MLNVIYCSTFHYTFIYPILLGLASFTLSLLWAINGNISKDKINKGEIPYGTHRFVNQWIMYLAESCAIICYYIKQLYFPINTFPKEKRERKKFVIHHILYFLLLGLFDVINNILGIIIDNSNIKIFENICLIIRFF